MRKLLEFPQINEKDLGKASELIETIADNLDKDCINSLVKFNKSYKDYEQLADVIKGKICGQEDID